MVASRLNRAGSVLAGWLRFCEGAKAGRLDVDDRSFPGMSGQGQWIETALVPGTDPGRLGPLVYYLVTGGLHEFDLVQETLGDLASGIRFPAGDRSDSLR